MLQIVGRSRPSFPRGSKTCRGDPCSKRNLSYRIVRMWTEPEICAAAGGTGRDIDWLCGYRLAVRISTGCGYRLAVRERYRRLAKSVWASPQLSPRYILCTTETSTEPIPPEFPASRNLLPLRENNPGRELFIGGSGALGCCRSSGGGDFLPHNFPRGSEPRRRRPCSDAESVTPNSKNWTTVP